MRKLLRRFSTDRRGALIAEFAAAMPILVLLLLGGVEVSRFALLNQRMDRLATVMGDLVAQAESLTETEITQLFQATEPVAWPFDMSARGNVIISSISIPPPNTVTPKVTWQRHIGNLVASSKIGNQNATPVMPGGLTVSTGQTIIVAEVYYDFRPMLIGSLVPAHRIYHRAFFRPRFGALTSLGAG